MTDVLKITQAPWQLMETKACLHRKTFPCVQGHDPLPMPGFGDKPNYAFMEAQSEDRRVEVRVCKACGCLYYECWELKGDKAE